MEKLVSQFDFDWNVNSQNAPGGTKAPSVSEEKATLLFMIDTINKHLVEIDAHPVRRTREILDDYAKQLLSSEGEALEKALFRFRQFFSGYRIDEYTYIHKTFDDFKKIIWDFVDELSDDLFAEKAQDQEVQASFQMLKEAVDANSIDLLKTNARLFIDSYVEYNSKKDQRRTKKIETIQKNLRHVKKRLVEASRGMNTDHLTQAFNRKSFDEQLKQTHRFTKSSKQPVCLLFLDIDHFKKVNDTFGHAMGDLVLIELVKILKELFYKEEEFIARLGGEEFAVILPNHNLAQAVTRAEAALNKVRAEVFVKDDMQIRFTVSIGIAQFEAGETAEHWLKRADEALYSSKNNGRNRYTIAPHKNGSVKVA
jgi:diguanylate cyclase (GGDEF)-like protein